MTDTSLPYRCSLCLSHGPEHEPGCKFVGFPIPGNRSLTERSPRCMRPGCERGQTMTGLCTQHNEQEANSEDRWREKHYASRKDS